MEHPRTDSDRIRQIIEDIALPHMDSTRETFGLAASPGTSSTLAASVADGQPAAYVDMGSTVSFVSGISEQTQRDILDSTLFGQVASDARFNRFVDPIDWLQQYFNYLQQLGWVGRLPGFSEFHGWTSSFTMDAVVVDTLEPIANGKEMGVVFASLNALRGQGQDGNGVQVFQRASTSDQSGVFQISVASEEDGAPVMKLGTYCFETSQSVTDLLWFQFDKRTTRFTYAMSTILLNEDVYAHVREPVIEKLGNRIGAFILPITLPTT